MVTATAHAPSATTEASSATTEKLRPPPPRPPPPLSLRVEVFGDQETNQKKSSRYCQVSHFSHPVLGLIVCVISVCFDFTTAMAGMSSKPTPSMVRLTD